MCFEKVSSCVAGCLFFGIPDTGAENVRVTLEEDGTEMSNDIFGEFMDACSGIPTFIVLGAGESWDENIMSMPDTAVVSSFSPMPASTVGGILTVAPSQVSFSSIPADTHKDAYVVTTETSVDEATLSCNSELQFPGGTPSLQSAALADTVNYIVTDVGVDSNTTVTQSVSDPKAAVLLDVPVTTLTRLETAEVPNSAPSVGK